MFDAGIDKFFISVQFDNQGEHPIDTGEVLVTLDGINPTTYSLAAVSQRNIGLVERVTKDQPTGGFERVDYEAQYKSDLAADIQDTLLAHVCYLYKTNSLTQLCLRKDVTTRAQDTDVCQISDPKSVGNSGAPVHVVNVLEKPAGKNKVSVTMTIQNVGEGEVYEPAHINRDRCESDEFDQGRVGVTITTDTNAPIICPKLSNSNKGIIRLVNNEGTISCLIDTSNLHTSTSQEVYKVTLDYVYKETISKSINVQNAAV